MPQSSNKTAFLRKKPPFLRVCKKSGKKTETPTAPMKHPFGPQKTERSFVMTYDAEELEQYPEIMNKEQLRKVCHNQQTDGALSAAVQSDPPRLHREENPLLRHQETRRHRLYDQPGDQPQPVHRAHQLVQIRKRGSEALQDPHSAAPPKRFAKDAALLRKQARRLSGRDRRGRCRGLHRLQPPHGLRVDSVRKAPCPSVAAQVHDPEVLSDRLALLGGAQHNHPQVPPPH